MIRVINGSLYYDWPWGIQRFESHSTLHLLPLHFILHFVSDIQDSVFIHGEETSVLPWDIAFPSFGCSPSIDSADFPSIWYRSFRDELDLYQRYLNANKDGIFHDEGLHNLYTERLNWTSRTSKAVFYGNMARIRHVLFDISVLHPECTPNQIFIIQSNLLLM